MLQRLIVIGRAHTGFCERQVTVAIDYLMSVFSVARASEHRTGRAISKASCLRATSDCVFCLNSSRMAS
jgi:hypothetical protein